MLVDLHGPEVIAFVIVVIVMMMAMRAMHMAVRDFFVGRRAHFGHVQVETQGHAGQRMIAVQHDLVVGDIGDGEDQRFFVVA